MSRSCDSISLSRASSVGCGGSCSTGLGAGWEAGISQLSHDLDGKDHSRAEK